MVHTNIKSRIKERGFTIVELLIVIVVIAILATITIVAYSGITSRANTTKAQTNAANVQKVLESFNANRGSYPLTITEITGYGGTAGDSSRLPSGITVLRGPAGTMTVTGPPANFPAAGTAPAGLANILNSAGVVTPLSSSNGLTSVAYSALSATTPNNGGVIVYYDFSTSAVSTTYIYVGSATSASTFVQPAA